MLTGKHAHLMQEINSSAIELKGRESDYSQLLGIIGNAQYVLIGEATHGTDEFYRMRAEITKKLITDHGFAAVAVEADWPDSYRINRYVRGDRGIEDTTSALSEFMRFPTWMWRNEAMVEFLDWLKEYNDQRKNPQDKIGFYGLDIYSLNASMKSVINYLERIDPPAARRAKQYYNCFAPYYSENPQEYGYASSLGLTRNCEDDAVRQLMELRQRAFDYARRNGLKAEDEYFSAEQNARVIVEAEKYYRTMFKGRASSWNLRDRHMTDTLYALTEHLGKQREEVAKVVVWAHNSHVGDARATDMGGRAEYNIGQLVRQSHGRNAVLIGFTTARGTVTAASEWDGPVEQKIIRPATPESYEALFHETGIPNFMLILRDNKTLTDHLRLNRLQRAIGVLYLPQTELASHYFFAQITEQFDVVIHLDTTHALRPLDTDTLWHKGEVFETYPVGL